MDHPSFDPQAAAQLRQVDPDVEEVITWRRFRALAFKMRNPDTGEEMARVIEFRKLDGSQVHQFVLDDDTRRMLLDALAYEDAPKIVVAS